MSTKTFRERSPVLIGIISIVAIALGTTGAFFIDRLPFVKQAYNIKAEFEDAAGIVAENQVRVAGIKVGTVESVELDGNRVLVELEIDNAIQIPDDAFAEIKLATLLGTKFIDIVGKGSGPYMEEGDLIPLERTAVPYEIFQASNEGTEVLEGLDGEALNEMLVELTKLVRVTQDELGAALEGLNEFGAGINAKDDELRELLAGANDLSSLLSGEGQNIVRLIDASNTVLASLSQQREELQSLLEATKTMSFEVTRLVRANRGNIDNILDRLHAALKVLEKNVEHLDLALEYAGPSTRYFGRIWMQGRWGDIYTCGLVQSGGCEH